tara:strand:+ start:27 stop:434 length:408 start_codon:yes stop_codon:yes gene_type:complete
MCYDNCSIFYALDFDFNNLNTDDLNIICIYRIPILCSYPKLLIHIYNSSQFLEILNKTNYNENKIINKLIKTINKIYDDKVFPNDIIDIKTEHFWDILINYFNDIDFSKNNNTDTIKNITSKKIYQRNMYSSKIN